MLKVIPLIKKYILTLLVVFLPTQLGLHLWPSWSYLSGFKIDYLAPTLYFTDILLSIYLISNHRKIIEFIRNHRLLVILIITFTIINISVSFSAPVAIIAWARAYIYLLTFITLLRENNLLQKIYIPLLFSTIAVVTLEFLQLIFQSSIGGLIQYLGERTFDLSTPNIAKIDINLFQNSLHLLRPYSTFSHPNSLSGYLLIVLLLLNVRKKLSPLINTYLIFGIFLTFSKAGIIALILLLPIYLIRNKSILTKIFFSLFLILVLVVSLSPILLSRYSHQFDFSSPILSRLYMGPPTLATIINYPLTGVGLNNYLFALKNELPTSQTFIYTLQPVHSLPLLIYSEIGIATLLLPLFLIKKVNVLQSTLLIPVMIILLTTGSVDHYWWTLTQNKLILIIVFAIIYKNEISRTNHKY